MDQSVLDALRRWPDVPAVFGWLSLSARGAWRLHPLGDAQKGAAGEGISNTQILGFMNRNYSHETDGRWFFQNGPQRVYVRLDAAPYILHLMPEEARLVTHTGEEVQQVFHWFADDTGQLYAQTDLGPARMDDRDLMLLSGELTDAQGQPFLETLEQLAGKTDLTNNPVNQTQLIDASGRYRAFRRLVPFSTLLESQVPQKLGFVANPVDTTVSAQAPQVT